MAAGFAAGQDEEGFEVSARSFVIMDAKTGKILLALNPQLFLPPASTLKVMTALSVVEHLKMDDKVSVSAYAAAAPASKIGIKPGENLYGGGVALCPPAVVSQRRRPGPAEKVCPSDRPSRIRSPRKCAVGRLPHHLRHGQRPAGGQSILHRPGPGPDVRRAMSNPETGQDHGHQVLHHPREIGKLRNHNRFLFTTPLAVGGKPGTPGPPSILMWGSSKTATRKSSVAMMGARRSG